MAEPFATSSPTGGSDLSKGFAFNRKKAGDTLQNTIYDLKNNNLIGKKQRRQFKKLSNSAGDLGADMGALATGDLATQGMTGAQQGADYAGATAGGYAGLANDVFLPGAQSLFDMGMDPQEELYDRTRQRLTEQQRVGQARRGIEMSPYGAGLEADALKDFNIDWENTALDRAIRGGGAASNMAQSGFQLGNDASKLAASGSLLPYSTALGFKQDEMAGNDAQRGALERQANFGTTANQVPQAIIANLQSMLGLAPAMMAANNANAAAPFDNAMKIPSLFGK